MQHTDTGIMKIFNTVHLILFVPEFNMLDLRV